MIIKLEERTRRDRKPQNIEKFYYLSQQCGQYKDIKTISRFCKY